MDNSSIKDTLYSIQHGLCACCKTPMFSDACIQYIDPKNKIRRIGYIELVHEKCQRGWCGSKNKTEMSTEHKKLVTEKLLKIFGNRCCFCGEPMALDKFNHGKSSSIEHIVPRSLGGGDEITNLLLAHRDCNSMHENYCVNQYKFTWEENYVGLSI